MQAVIVTGGKQYSVKEGDVVFVEKLNAEAGESVMFDQVLAVLDGETVSYTHLRPSCVCQTVWSSSSPRTTAAPMR